jgi:hypothetical protein
MTISDLPSPAEAGVAKAGTISSDALLRSRCDQVIVPIARYACPATFVVREEAAAGA